MSRRAKALNRPLSMRLSESDMAVIDRAAMRCERSRSDFVRVAAVQAAEEVMGGSRIRMSAGGFDAFMAAVSGPRVAAPEMVEVFRRSAPWDAARSVKES
jgi:uncharacterized protein (DUF1778 family)